MGTIQNSFNQLLGISAIAGKAIGGEMLEQANESYQHGRDLEDLDKDMENSAREMHEKEAQYSNIENEMNEFQGDKRSKSYRQLKKAYDSLESEINDANDRVNGLLERRKLLSERYNLSKEQLLKGAFASKEKATKMANKETNKIMDDIYSKEVTDYDDEEYDDDEDFNFSGHAKGGR